jgi:hypothetical protein
VVMSKEMQASRLPMRKFLTEKLYKVEGVHEAESFMHLKIVKETYF